MEDYIDYVDGDFDTWCDKITSSEITYNNLSVTYHAPDIGKIHFGWDDPLTLNDQEISLRNYPRFNNPYCHTEYNTGQYNIQFQNQKLQLEF